MKKDIIISLIVTGLIPALLLPGITNLLRKDRIATEEMIVDGNDEIIYTEQESDVKTVIPVTVSTNSGILTLELDAYVTRVVLAEMPADFEIEALKAQAVVARTYTCKKSQNSKHPDAMVCSNSVCCQAYITEEEYIKSGGTEFMVEKVKQAVSATAGEVLQYDGELIEATYFSCSGGRTESAQAVWGTDVPYLQAVESPGEEIAVHYTDTVTFTVSQFSNLLGVSLSGNCQLSVEDITYTEGGGVDTITIGGTVFSGVTIRKLLNLRSTAFVITAIGDKIIITTKGYGHRVGMSQYGAEAMALQGKDYQSILSYYYSGTRIHSILG